MNKEITWAGLPFFVKIILIIILIVFVIGIIIPKVTVHDSPDLTIEEKLMAMECLTSMFGGPAQIIALKLGAFAIKKESTVFPYDGIMATSTKIYIETYNIFRIPGGVVEVRSSGCGYAY